MQNKIFLFPSVCCSLSESVLIVSTVHACWVWRSFCFNIQSEILLQHQNRPLAILMMSFVTAYVNPARAMQRRSSRLVFGEVTVREEITENTIRCTLFFIKTTNLTHTKISLNLRYRFSFCVRCSALIQLVYKWIL